MHLYHYHDMQTTQSTLPGMVMHHLLNRQNLSCALYRLYHDITILVSVVYEKGWCQDDAIGSRTAAPPHLVSEFPGCAPIVRWKM